MNIALVCDGIGDVIGGSFLSTARFGERLHLRGHRVVFISSGSREQAHDRTYRGMPIHRLPGVLLPRSGHLRLALPVPSRLRALLQREQIDVVHVMLPTPLGVIAGSAATAMGVPLVMHSHTQAENIFMNGPRFPGRAALTRIFERYLAGLYGRGDALVHPSAFSRRRFAAPGGRCDRVISNGVDRHRFHPQQADGFMRRFQLSRANQHLLYVGRLHPEKSVETLIRAMPLLLVRRPHTHLLIAGIGYKRSMLAELVRTHDLTPHVTFCGFVPDADLPEAYNACDLFVLPSLAELEGIAVLEAMACGKPLLIADAKDSAATAFVDGNGVLFRAGDSRHLAEQAIRLLSDATQLRAMSALSLTKSRSYDIEESAMALEHLYYSLIAARTPSKNPCISIGSRAR